MYVVSARVQHDVSAHCRSGRASVRQGLDGHDMTCTRGSGQLHQTQPDGPTSDDGDSCTYLELSQVVGVQRHAQRFKHGRSSIAERVRHRVQQSCGPGDELTQTPVVDAMAGKSNRRAEVSVALEALLTDPTWQSRVDGNPPPVVWTTLDDPCELMPKNQRMAELSVTNTTVGEPVQVGTTQTDGGHPNQALPPARKRSGLIGDANIADTMKPGDLHGRLTAVGS
jgi:hypothetical protein